VRPPPLESSTVGVSTAKKRSLPAQFCSGNDTFQPMHKNSFRLLNKPQKFQKIFFPVEKFKKKV
jgi:hypothetical protein